MKSALRLAAIVPEKILLGAHFTRHYQFEHVIGVARSIADTALAVLDLPQLPANNRTHIRQGKK